MTLSGVVLAGGRSTRMGSDKALIEHPSEGGPTWRRQRDVLRAAGAVEILLSARDDQMWLPRTDGFAAILFDGVSVGGAIIGVTAGLERASHSHLAVLAIDLPGMNAEWFRELRAECAPGVGVVGRRGDFFEPLAAIYPKELMMDGWEALVRGDFSLQRFVATAVAAGRMRVREISAADAGQFEKWNVPGDARR